MHTGKRPRAKSVHSSIPKQSINRRISIRVEAEEKIVRKTKQSVEHTSGIKTESARVNRIS